MARKLSRIDQVLLLIDSVEDASTEPSANYSEISKLVGLAQVHAIIAVAEELGRLRDSVDAVASGLRDRDNGTAGTHLYYISDWLKDIAERR
ncbi:hypothetical protein ACQEVC_45380 [Plantactinospora sp. CA-294935]|uniref:hypothetical protein n=1 Tax=Plantactinospora sp. CA-294935 TaxID=3240012 RepID=UPI003D928DAA